MEKKLMQVTDNIHGTIYLSALESELISTPYFYRLHDIYQSSTVYMTFPSNRTKRYEHSLGTMELASSMLFSAVSNADKETREELFRRLRGYMNEVVKLAFKKTNDQVATYFVRSREYITNIFSKISNGQQYQSAICKYIKKAVSERVFADTALDFFQFYPMEMKDADMEYSTLNEFLYRCLLESVRIVALFHDVGHPPYSHIIEDVLTKLYKECCGKEGKEWDPDKRDELKQNLDPYASENHEEAFKCHTLLCNSSLVKAKLHERVGFSLLQSALDDVITQLIENVAKTTAEKSYKVSMTLYYILVTEFATAILVEKDFVFKAFHKIVDGPLDADRFDYIMRDSLNSGVDWGKIPYKRVINKAKLMYLTEIEGNKLQEDNFTFVIAFPKSVAEDIVDTLLTRYKIFARINFHHRCMKTTVALQSCVLDLARDYLKASGDDCISTEISGLWNALTSEIGDRRIRIIRWNDSWLISLLHEALGTVMQMDADVYPDRLFLQALKENLEEILLSRKRYYSLIKRGGDCQRFIKRVYECAGITDDGLSALNAHETVKYYDNKRAEFTKENLLSLPRADAEESLLRIDKLITIKKNGDFELLNWLMPLDKMCINTTLMSVLEEEKIGGRLADYKTIVNYGRAKTGVPSHEGYLEAIYLYNGKDLFRYDDSFILKPQIEAIEKSIPWIYVYMVPPKENSDVQRLSQDIFELMAVAVGKNLRARYCELFGDWSLVRSIE